MNTYVLFVRINESFVSISCIRHCCSADEIITRASYNSAQAASITIDVTVSKTYVDAMKFSAISKYLATYEFPTELYCDFTFLYFHFFEIHRGKVEFLKK